MFHSYYASCEKTDLQLLIISMRTVLNATKNKKYAILL